MATYNLFISHSWRYGDQYTRLINLLKANPFFSFRDYSVPANDPIHNAPYVWQLRQAIRNQMAPCSAVIVLAGVYASYSKWIDEEIELAKRGFAHAKPIIAIRPRGNERMSVKVQEAANLIVGWNTNSVIRAIREVT